MKFITVAFLLATLSAHAQTETLADPLLHQGLINNENYVKVVRIADNYKKRNTINAGWMNVFRTWNSAETLQNRTALENKRSPEMMIFDMDRGQPLDWANVTLDRDNNPSTSEAQFSLALDTTNLENPEAPVVLILLSNQHVLNDYLSNNAYLEIRKMGIVLAAMEYPGFGVSVGIASKKSWIKATQDSVRYLHSITGKKIYLLGHSIGGPLALETAATPEMKGLVGGAMSYGGFTTLTEMAKDQGDTFLMQFFAPMIARLTMAQNIIDGISGLKTLARNGIPALIMHGENDGPVPVRHTKLYAKEVQRLRIGDMVKTKIFPGLIHEEVNNFSRGVEQSERDFHLVWDEIRNFLDATNQHSIFP